MEPLTEREHEIARLANAGLSPNAIATELSLSVRSVENHIYAMCAKLGISSTAELAAIDSNESR